MGFTDRAKKLVAQAQQEAKDGTLKERAKGLADQAQTKLGEVQDQLSERRGGRSHEDGPGTPETPATPATAAAPEPDTATTPPPRPTGGDPAAG